MKRLLIVSILLFCICSLNAELVKFKYLNVPANDVEIYKYIDILKKLDHTIYRAVPSRDEELKIWEVIHNHQIDNNRSFIMIIDDMMVVGYKVNTRYYKGEILK